MKVKPEIQAMIDELAAVLPPRNRVVIPTPAAKVVVNEDRVVRDANPHVSRADPNFANSDEGVVTVRRPGFVTIDMALYEQQQAWKAAQRRHRRAIDPFRLGHWGPNDDDAA
jgi:hypothetical protein